MLRCNNKIVIKKTKIANTFFKRAKGLMFSLQKNFNYALIFDLQRSTVVGASIHMFFVFFPINIIYLNEKKEVVDIKKNLKPFQIYNTSKKTRYIIELPIDLDIKKVNIKDKISW